MSASYYISGPFLFNQFSQNLLKSEKNGLKKIRLLSLGIKHLEHIQRKIGTFLHKSSKSLHLEL